MITTMRDHDYADTLAVPLVLGVHVSAPKPASIRMRESASRVTQAAKSHGHTWIRITIARSITCRQFVANPLILQGHHNTK